MSGELEKQAKTLFYEHIKNLDYHSAMESKNPFKWNTPLMNEFVTFGKVCLKVVQQELDRRLSAQAEEHHACVMATIKEHEREIQKLRQLLLQECQLADSLEARLNRILALIGMRIGHLECKINFLDIESELHFLERLREETTKQ